MASRKPKKSRRAKLGISLITAAGVILAASTLLMRQTTPSKYNGPIEHLNVGTVAEYSSLSIIAQDKGYFKQNGVEVAIKDYESGPPAVADLLAGKIDVATAADFVGVRNSFADEDLNIVAAQAKAESFFLVVRSDHGINRSGDLLGKRVGVTRKTAGEFYLGQFLVANQLSLRDITIIDGTPSQLVERLSRGELDAIVTFDPHISKAKSLLGTSAIVWSAQDQKLSPLLYSTGKLTGTRPEAVKRYLQALVQAEQFIQAHNDQARATVAQHLHYDKDYMQTIWSHLSFSLSLDQELLIDLESQARWVIANHLTTATTVPNYLHLIYFDGLAAVKPEGITIIR